MSSYLIIAVRTIGAYLILFIMARLMGKRQIAQMTFFDYIAGITIGSITAIFALDTSIKWSDGVVALLVFGLFQIIYAFISLKSSGFRKVVSGSPTVLIDKGKILEDNLSKEKVSISKLTSMLREKNAFKLADVEFAFLETDGEISVMLKPEKQPVTPSDLKLPAAQSSLPELVIEDGQVKDEGMKKVGITRAWLMTKLGENGINKVSDVMAAQVDSLGNLYVDRYDDEAK
jgi:uncharacterized membrane protein YcaP (DUF421 family)